MKSEVPRDKTASRNNRQNEQHRHPSNNRSELKGEGSGWGPALLALAVGQSKP